MRYGDKVVEGKSASSPISNVVEGCFHLETCTSRAFCIFRALLSITVSSCPSPLSSALSRKDLAVPTLSASQTCPSSFREPLSSSSPLSEASENVPVSPSAEPVQNPSAPWDRVGEGEPQSREILTIRTQFRYHGGISHERRCSS